MIYRWGAKSEKFWLFKKLFLSIRREILKENRFQTVGLPSLSYIFLRVEICNKQSNFENLCSIS